jgi:hypothetical protein
MNRLVTVDSIVRSYINAKGMVWHDYFRLLVIALDGVRNLAMDINIGTNVKIKELCVNEFGEMFLPSDCVKVNKILTDSGDKLYGMSEVDNINPIPKVDANGNRSKRMSDQEMGDHPTGNYPFMHTTERGEFGGRFFGIPSAQPFAYQDFGDKIQFDARLDLKCVYVIYTTKGVNLCDNNLIHPWAEDAVKYYIEWKYVEARKGIWENQNERRYYHTEKRNAYSRIHGLGFEEYMEIVRSNNIATFKA